MNHQNLLPNQSNRTVINVAHNIQIVLWISSYMCYLLSFARSARRSDYGLDNDTIGLSLSVPQASAAPIEITTAQVNPRLIRGLPSKCNFAPLIVLVFVEFGNCIYILNLATFVHTNGLGGGHIHTCTYLLQETGHMPACGQCVTGLIISL